ncbi:molybdopterin-dependent oxidoreductase [Geobacter pelophilus]|uniref:Molybdopterin-dependent oxidoreductase n=1 Tax=Geoanaerobacter pelophilus TaxID=60036 RepID=A0AAW4L8Q4_9BACT|nr:molybdopterin-dependent oxidoreductase [Geoanaerobacter pelophilus]MBT0664686.1 molybdopterin-dependent oxidoreductase [Geoanaerobacter pelophilus]
MAKLTIDHIPVTVTDGTSILEAAKSVGIWIPHFCYHPALGKAGACRVCAVKLLDGPVKGIQMSCMLPAADGMVVSTTDEEAVAMRRQVIEWLMINHPHDCPVCDEGGECLLQDYTIAGGHSIRRYTGSKRTHRNQELGPHIEHEMNRCIQCYRCARFYQEFAGGDDFGVMGSAARVYFGRFSDGPLASPFSGNLVDICPTGVFTDKTARFRARYWDYDMAPSICPHCSLGCNTMPVARYRELLKIVSRRNDQVNGWFICDRGRFGADGVNAPNRPRTPLVDGRQASWDEAIDDLLLRINEVQELHGPDSIALLGSPRMTLEGNLLLAQLASLLGATLCYHIGSTEQTQAVAATQLVSGERAASMNDVGQADCIVIAGCDLLDAGPMMALAVRQAWRRGAKVFLVNAPTSRLPFEYACAGLFDEIPFATAKQPVVIGTASDSDRLQPLLESAQGIKVAMLLPGPNSFATALLAQEHGTLPLEEAIAGGSIKGIISFEPETPDRLPTDIQLLAVADWRPSPAVSRAGIFLPITPWVEMDGTFINNEGRAQRFRQVMRPGLPIKGLDPAGHPPRLHGNEAPGSLPRPTAEIIAGIFAQIAGEPAIQPLSGRWQFAADLDPEGDGVRVVQP